MKKSILKDILLHLCLPLGILFGVGWLVKHFFGGFPLAIYIAIVYGWATFTTHRNKKKQIAEIVTKSNQPVSSYELAKMTMEAHRVSPESLEVTKLMIKLVSRLGDEHSAKAER